MPRAGRVGRRVCCKGSPLASMVVNSSYRLHLPRRMATDVHTSLDGDAQRQGIAHHVNLHGGPIPGVNCCENRVDSTTNFESDLAWVT